MSKKTVKVRHQAIIEVQGGSKDHRASTRNGSEMNVGE